MKNYEKRQKTAPVWDINYFDTLFPTFGGGVLGNLGSPVKLIFYLIISSYEYDNIK